jgi:hypothetical protein
MATKPFAQLATASDYRNIKEFKGFAAYWRTRTERGRVVQQSLVPLALFVDERGHQYAAPQRTLRLWGREALHMVPNAPLRGIVLGPAEQMWQLTRPLYKAGKGETIPCLIQSGVTAVVSGKDQTMPIIKVL